QIQRIRFASHDERYKSGGFLREWLISFSRRFLLQAVVFHVADDADYLPPDFLAHCYMYAFANGVFVREIAVRHRFIDYNYARGVFIVVLGEYSPTEQRYAHCGEEVGADSIVLRGRKFGVCAARLPFDNKAEIEITRYRQYIGYGH